ncbi:hypothetical protein D3C71_2079420 [compost metagenome]
MISNSFAPKPRVVPAEEPRRNPFHSEGLVLSNGIGFLFEVMLIAESASCDC